MEPQLSGQLTQGKQRPLRKQPVAEDPFVKVDVPLGVGIEVELVLFRLARDVIWDWILVFYVVAEFSNECLERVHVDRAPRVERIGDPDEQLKVAGVGA